MLRNPFALMAKGDFYCIGLAREYCYTVGDDALGIPLTNATVYRILNSNAQINKSTVGDGALDIPLASATVLSIRNPNAQINKSTVGDGALDIPPICTRTEMIFGAQTYVKS